MEVNVTGIVQLVESVMQQVNLDTVINLSYLFTFCFKNNSTFGFLSLLMFLIHPLALLVPCYNFTPAFAHLFWSGSCPQHCLLVQPFAVPSQCSPPASLIPHLSQQPACQAGHKPPEISK